MCLRVFLTNFAQLSVNKIEFYDKNWTWSEMFDKVGSSAHAIVDFWMMPCLLTCYPV